MMYTLDFVFILVYLACEKKTTNIQNKRLRWFFRVREIMQWLQFLTIIIYLYARPYHDITEKLVSFGAMTFTKLVVDFIAMRSCKRERKKYIDTKSEL